MREVRERTLVRCLVLDSATGELLVLRRSSRESFGASLWELLQGGREIGETGEQAVLREIQEEIGVDAARLLTSRRNWLSPKYATLAPVSTSHFQINHPDGHVEDWLNVNYVLAGRGLRARMGQLTLDEDHDELQWAKAEGAIELLGSHEYSLSGVELIRQLPATLGRLARLVQLLRSRHAR